MVIVILNLGPGSLETGLPNITAQLWETKHRTPTQLSGSLPPDLNLAETYSKWRNLYQDLGNLLQNNRNQSLIEFEDDDDYIGQISEEDLANLSQQLTEAFNLWLNSPSFSRIERLLRTKLSKKEAISIIIETNDEQLRRIPWHLWDFYQDYPEAEIALSSQEHERLEIEKTFRRQQVRILAVLGNSKGINVQKDLEILQRLPHTEVIFLAEPSRSELDRWLWDEWGWDIFFFAGHSCSKTEAIAGELEINAVEKLAISQLRNALKKAINLGLQLAIFNSCDGLGLAYELADLQIPQIIVMRENVPDIVAQVFLKNFLTTFAKGQSFYSSVREAKERLQGLEGEYPCASWLPVVCQNPTHTPLTWQDLFRQKKPAKLFSKTKLKQIIIAGISISIIVMTMRYVGILQQGELKALDLLMRQLPQESLDPRILIIGADEEDISSSRYGFPLTDETLLQLFEQLQSYQPAVVGVDIFRDQPVPVNSEHYNDLQEYWRENSQLVGICTFSDQFIGSVAPPESIAQERVGFVDLYSDADDHLRRYLLSRSLNSPDAMSRCNTSYAFAWQLAYRYLKSKNIPVTTVGKDWRFGDVKFPRLKKRSGGYQNLEIEGNQMVINYRRTSHIAQQITIRDVLEKKDYFRPEWVKDRIVLIGVIAPSVPDRHDTFLGKMRGIEIHAQVISEIISAVEDARPVIWWLPQIIDYLWILFWSGLGAIAFNLSLSRRHKLIITTGIVLTLNLLSCLSLYFGLWLPLLPALIALTMNSLWSIIDY